MFKVIPIIFFPRELVSFIPLIELAKPKIEIITNNETNIRSIMVSKFENNR